MRVVVISRFFDGLSSSSLQLGQSSVGCHPIMVVWRYYIPWLMSMAWIVASKESKMTKMKEVVRWSTVKFYFPTLDLEDSYEKLGKYKPERCLPLGLGVHGDRLFVTFPKWKSGIPATLAVAKLDGTPSPLLSPYPSLEWNDSGCNGLTSVFRIDIDSCGRLWVLDSGSVNIAQKPKQVCSPQIVVFDLATNTLVAQHRFGGSTIPSGALFTNIVVDVRDGDCQNAFAYVSDVFRYGVHVFDLANDKSWRIEHPYFYPDPISSTFSIDGFNFTWMDGVFGMALAPKTPDNDRFLYFHPLSSFREFRVPTSYLRSYNKTKGPDPFEKVGRPRKLSRGHSSGSAMDRSGVLFYNLISRNAVGCWNPKLGAHTPGSQGLVGKSKTELSFPNDLRVDNEEDQGLWVLSNQLHKFLYSTLDPNQINFRVHTVKTKDAIVGTPCDPSYVPPETKKRQKKRRKPKCREPNQNL